MSAPVQVNASDLLEGARREGNLLPAFQSAVVINRKLAEALLEDGVLEPIYEDIVDDGNWLLGYDGAHMPADSVFAILERSVSEVVELVWDGMGPISTATTFYLVRDILGEDIFFRHDELEGYPVVLITPSTSGSSMSGLMVKGVADVVASHGLPDHIINYRPEWIDWRELAVEMYKRLELANAWGALRARIVDSVLYSGPLDIGMLVDKLRIAGIGTDHAADVAKSMVEPISKDAKLRLLLTYVENYYREEFRR